MTVSDLPTGEYAEFYATYTKLVPDVSIPEALTESGKLLEEYLRGLPASHRNYAYAAGKWTVKEALQHVIDTERIFGNRALRLGRHDKSALPGFDQDTFAARADVTALVFTDMIEEFSLLRRSNVLMFGGFTADDLVQKAVVSGHEMSCRAMGFIMAGHVYHHNNLYRERYGSGAA